MPLDMRSSALRVKAAAEGWAARLKIPADDAFWDKWNNIARQDRICDPPPADGKRCPLCKRRCYFLEDNSRNYLDNCDGVCSKSATKIVAAFGFDRRDNKGTTEGALKRPGMRGKAGMRGPEGPGKAAPARRNIKDESSKTAPKELPAHKRCARKTDDGWRCGKARLAGRQYCSDRCERLVCGVCEPAAAAAREDGVVAFVKGHFGFIAAKDPKVGRIFFLTSDLGGAAEEDLAVTFVVGEHEGKPVAREVRAVDGPAKAKPAAEAPSPPRSSAPIGSEEWAREQAQTARAVPAPPPPSPMDGRRRCGTVVRRTGTTAFVLTADDASLGELAFTVPPRASVAAGQRVSFLRAPTARRADDVRPLPAEADPRGDYELQAALRASLAGGTAPFATHPGDDDMARALALSMEQTGPPPPPVQDDYDTALAAALALSAEEAAASSSYGGGYDPSAIRTGLVGPPPPPRNLDEYLRRISLEHYLASFQREDIDLGTLEFLQVEDLVEGVGLPLAQAQVVLAHRHLIRGA